MLQLQTCGQIHEAELSCIWSGDYVNPFYNPYVEYGKGEGGSDYICPTQSAPYAYRDNEFAYKIDKNDLCYKLFKEHGFIWGGDWNSCKDYQHFEKRLIKR